MKIRVFVDAHVFDQEFQGTRTFIRELYTALASRPSIQLFVAVHSPSNVPASLQDLPNVTVVRYKSTASWKRLLFEIPALIKKHEIDFAHFQYIVAPVKRCRYILTIHDLIFNDFPGEFTPGYIISKNLLFGLSLLRADIVTTVSDYSRSSIKKYLRTSKKILLTPNGVSSHFFRPFNKADSQHHVRERYGIGKYILYVSRFEPRKNHLGLLRAFVDLRLFDAGYHLVLLGHSSIKVDDFEKFYAALDPAIRRMVFVSSTVNDEDLMHFYKGAEVFVYPSKAEGFGIPPLEAAALRVPVLCSNTSAMSDFSFFGRYHFDPNDQEEFRSKLAEILTVPLPAGQLNDISWIIAERFSWEKSANTLYKEILETYHSSKNRQARDQS